MMRLKYLLTLITLAGWRVAETVFSQASLPGHAFSILAAAILLAAEFFLLSVLSRGRREGASVLRLGNGFLLSGPPTLAAIFSAAFIVYLMKFHYSCTSNCWVPEAFVPHITAFIIWGIWFSFEFYVVIFVASFIAEFAEIVSSFRGEMRTGSTALRSSLGSRRLKCSLTAIVLTGWYAQAVYFELPVAVGVLLALATSLLLAVLLLALPIPTGRTDRSIFELGAAFLLAGPLALAAAIANGIAILDISSGNACVFYDCGWFALGDDRMLLSIVVAATVTLAFYAIIIFEFVFVALIPELEKLLAWKAE